MSDTLPSAKGISAGTYMRARRDVWRGDEDPYIALARGTLVWVLDVDEFDVQVSKSNGATFTLSHADLEAR